MNIIDQMNAIAGCIISQFGRDCEVAIYESENESDFLLVSIKNGFVSSSEKGDSLPVEIAAAKKAAADKNSFSTIRNLSDGSIIKSSATVICDENSGKSYLFLINYNITNLITMNSVINDITKVQGNNVITDATNRKTPLVNDLLDSLIKESVDRIGKPAALMTKDEKISAIQFLNDSGAFLITRSGDRISKFFGISKYTLYSYIDISNRSR